MAGFKEISKNHFRITSRDGKWIYEIYRNDTGEVICDEFYNGKDETPAAATPAPGAKDPKPAPKKKRAVRSIFEDEEEADDEGSAE